MMMEWHNNSSIISMKKGEEIHPESNRILLLVE